MKKKDVQIGKVYAAKVSGYDTSLSKLKTLEESREEEMEVEP